MPIYMAHAGLIFLCASQLQESMHISNAGEGIKKQLSFRRVRSLNTKHIQGSDMAVTGEQRRAVLLETHVRIA